MPTTFLLIGKGSKLPERQGHISSSWTPAIDNRKNEVIRDPRSPPPIARRVQLAPSVPNQLAIRAVRSRFVPIDNILH